MNLCWILEFWIELSLSLKAGWHFSAKNAESVFALTRSVTPDARPIKPSRFTLSRKSGFSKCRLQFRRASSVAVISRSDLKLKSASQSLVTRRALLAKELSSHFNGQEVHHQLSNADMLKSVFSLIWICKNFSFFDYRNLLNHTLRPLSSKVAFFTVFFSTYCSPTRKLRVSDGENLATNVDNSPKAPSCELNWDFLNSKHLNGLIKSPSTIDIYGHTLRLMKLLRSERERESYIIQCESLRTAHRRRRRRQTRNHQATYTHKSCTKLSVT